MYFLQHSVYMQSRAFAAVVFLVYRQFQLVGQILGVEQDEVEVEEAVA